ncbi:UbiH/UbiF/VisC/COQ6 family ubiquinone biosynthesis hydroxylase [Simiduia agarivorans]|uniref:2-octaprenyl-3-methyl-6-methoxy-1,4-benzoquinol hydroxylase n=1 Tax=Simiduia agarivorans (strain DSM 21679 / JCM 13881 / BCRC 17597 / SA1) TaxID=1117647 RepID=K4L1B9_SIMAS|nr:UbiH/UbiF/VisC/COQ6 family ubiquinone biosynthesis hydroxylase [Simiduia agarivorans]AFU99972.1 2-octaprenyl-3-methyl-6-methoxy-1,4-benzoquinol hydroxylase [Simiduia agarivorans SA1 = DSM 21679]
MTETNRRNADIAVVGAGLVGALFALLHARRHPQQQVLLLEAGADTAHFDAGGFDPRVVALTQASVNLLDEAGIWQKVLTARACAYTAMDVWDAEGTGDIQFFADDVHQPQLGFIVENSLLLSHLHQAISYTPNIQLQLNARVKQLLLPAADANGDATLLLASGETLRVQLIVAADGARSSLRELAGLATREWDYGHDAIVTTIRTQKPHDFVARQRFMRSGPLAFLPLQASAQAAAQEFHCSIVWSAETPLAKQLMQLGDDEFCDSLTRASEACLGQVVHADKRFAIPLRQRHAVDYIRPGFALIGDAAHTIHPLAGQGVNLGIKDVAALLTELDRASARGLALGHGATLRRYQRARKADNLATMAAMEGFKQLFGADHHLLRWLRNEGLKLANRSGLVKREMIKQAMGL